MCGICGLVNPSTAVGANSTTVAAMTVDLERRGPDDLGQWQDESSRTVLGFRRLSIIDLSPAGHQPMSSADGRDVIVFNGEIYNHTDLRGELAASGVAFRSRSDTEVLLEALRHWGLDATLPRLRGMFAFAWYRPEGRRLVLARDHVGIKPLYYAVEPRGPGVAFSSRYDSLFRTGWLDRDAVDPAALRAYLHHRRVPAPAALHRGAAQVAPGGYVVAGPGGIEDEVRWWRLGEGSAELRGDDAVEATAEAVERSVRRHLVSDVPVGVFLSAGVDSPLVAGTAARVADRPMRSFTIGVPGWEGDEGPAAEALAGPLGLEHRTRSVGPPSTGEVHDLLAALHEPVNDLSILPTLSVSRFARTEVTVALSGDGGDELFFGYARPWATDAHRLLWRLPRPARRVPVGVLSRTGRLRYRATLHQDPGAYYRAMHRSTDEPTLAAVAPGLEGAPEPDPFRYPGRLDRRTLATFGRSIDAEVQLNRILTKVDMASMQHSLEVRVPLLDPDVIATSLRIDPAWTMAQPRTKPVLRTLLDRLVPSGLVPEQKRGFTVPLADWLSGPLSPLVEDTLAGDLWPTGVFDADAVQRCWQEHRTGRQRTILLWGVLVLQWWGARVDTLGRPGASP
jgi:asparagine synthase (glutamine-hydrolysing)